MFVQSILLAELRNTLYYETRSLRKIFFFCTVLCSKKKCQAVLLEEKFNDTSIAEVEPFSKVLLHLVSGGVRNMQHSVFESMNSRVKTKKRQMSILFQVYSCIKLITS